jgi:hypothetical protein
VAGRRSFPELQLSTISEAVVLQLAWAAGLGSADRSSNCVVSLPHQQAHTLLALCDTLARGETTKASTLDEQLRLLKLTTKPGAKMVTRANTLMQGLKRHKTGLLARFAVRRRADHSEGKSEPETMAAFDRQPFSSFYVPAPAPEPASRERDDAADVTDPETSSKRPRRTPR